MYLPKIRMEKYLYIYTQLFVIEKKNLLDGTKCKHFLYFERKRVHLIFSASFLNIDIFLTFESKIRTPFDRSSLLPTR